MGTGVSQAPDALRDAELELALPGYQRWRGTDADGRPAAVERLDDLALAAQLEAIAGAQPTWLAEPLRWRRGGELCWSPRAERAPDGHASAAALIAALAAAHGDGCLLGLLSPASLGARPDGTLGLRALGLGRAALACDERELPAELRACLAPESEGQPALGADLFALGASLFVLLTGETPQPGDLPSALTPELPPACDELFRNTYVRKQHRYPDTAALLADLLPALPPSGEARLADIAAALAPSAPVETPAEPARPRVARVDPLARPLPLPAPAPLATLDAIVAEETEALQQATAAGRFLITAGSWLLILAALIYGLSSGHWAFGLWTAVFVLPLAVMLRMAQGDLDQRRHIERVTVPRLLAWSEESDTSPLFVWQHAARGGEATALLRTWLTYHEEQFLPEPMRKPPARMGGVSRIP